MKKMNNSLYYWSQRQAKAQAVITDKGIAATEKQLIKYYKSSMKKIQGQFEETYLKLLSTINEGEKPTPADLYKLDKYWQLQAQLKDELTALGDKQAAVLSKQFEDQYINIYNAAALKDTGMFSEIDRATAHQMINQVWCADGKTWSQRVWNNTDKLQQALNDNLIDCVLTGKKTTDLKNMLQNDFQVSYSRADTIVRTEMARIQTVAAKQRYEDYGIEQVEILADDAGCDECDSLNGQRFYINDALPIPAHPNCRCCIIPVVE